MSIDKSEKFEQTHQRKHPTYKGEVHSLVTLQPSVYSEIVVEIVRWNDAIRRISSNPYLLEVG